VTISRKKQPSLPNSIKGEQKHPTRMWIKQVVLQWFSADAHAGCVNTSRVDTSRADQ
jgi:hypothetical protein